MSRRQKAAAVPKASRRRLLVYRLRM